MAIEMIYENEFGELQNEHPESLKAALELWYREECLMFINGVVIPHMPNWIIFRVKGFFF